MHNVDLSPVYGFINEALVILLGALATWLGLQVRQWISAHVSFLGQATDKTLADGFDRALQNGIAIALQQAHTYEGEHSTVAINGWLAAKAAQYAIDHSPDYMARFGLSPDDIATKALAHLPPPVVTVDTTGVKVTPTHVDIEPLPPAK